MRVTISSGGELFFEAGYISYPISIDPRCNEAFGSNGKFINLDLYGLQSGQKVETIHASFNELVYLRDVLNRIIREKVPE